MAFTIKICNFANYYPFGMQHTGTEGSYDLSGDYRYGYNGKEEDDEIKGEANSLDFGARVYDPRVGKFLSVDPRSKSYPSISHYLYAENSPISNVDVNGEWAAVVFGSARVAVGLSLGVTTSIGIGLAVDGDMNLGIYKTTTIGAFTGVPGGVASASVGVNWTADNIWGLKGGGFSAGLTVSGLAKWWSGELNWGEKDPVPVGFNAGPPAAGGGFIGALYVERTSTELLYHLNMYEEAKSIINKMKKSMTVPLPAVGDKLGTNQLNNVYSAVFSKVKDLTGKTLKDFGLDEEKVKSSLNAALVKAGLVVDDSKPASNSTTNSTQKSNANKTEEKKK